MKKYALLLIYFAILGIVNFAEATTGTATVQVKIKIERLTKLQASDIDFGGIVLAADANASDPIEIKLPDSDAAPELTDNNSKVVNYSSADAHAGVIDLQKTGLNKTSILSVKADKLTYGTSAIDFVPTTRTDERAGKVYIGGTLSFNGGVVAGNYLGHVDVAVMYE